MSSSEKKSSEHEMKLGRLLIFDKLEDACTNSADRAVEVHNLASVHSKSIKLGQITNRDLVVSVYRLVKI